MKALTLHQPWATLIVLGGKRFETRSWGTEYRGQLAIHAGQVNALGGIVSEVGINPEIVRVFNRCGVNWRNLPRGAVLGVATLVDCDQMTPELIENVSMQERWLGDWQPGRWAWQLDNVLMFDEPIRQRGYQGLWDWQTDHEHVGMTMRISR